MEKFFVYIRPKNGEFISPFLLSKHLETTIGRIQSAKHTKEGLLVQITKKQAEKVDGSKAGTVELQVTYNEFLNTSKGLIFFPEFKYITDEEILAELKDQNVSHITRFLKKGDQMRNEKGTTEGKTNTGLFLIQFNKPTKPESLIICHERVNVRVYYPNPMRCNKCHKFGHKEKNCRSKIKICGHCAEAQQDNHDCSEEPPKCVNCNGSHPSWTRTCPRYLEEQSIIKYATDHQVPFKEARQRQQTNVRITSFADTVQQKSEIERLQEQVAQLIKQNQVLTQTIAKLEQHQANGAPAADKSLKQPAQQHLKEFQKELQQKQQQQQSNATFQSHVQPQLQRTITTYEDMIYDEEDIAETQTTTTTPKPPNNPKHSVNHKASKKIKLTAETESHK